LGGFSWTEPHKTLVTALAGNSITSLIIFRVNPNASLHSRSLSLQMIQINKLLEHFRQKTFILLSKAYTALSVKDASTYLGLPPDEVTKSKKIELLLLYS
jgi:hypothetical protein